MPSSFLQIFPLLPCKYGILIVTILQWKGIDMSELAKETKNSDLGTAPIGKLLFRLAVPSITAQLINALYNIVDRIYIGRLPGEGKLALAGLGIAFPIIMIISGLCRPHRHGRSTFGGYQNGGGKPPTRGKNSGKLFYRPDRTFRGADLVFLFNKGHAALLVRRIG